MRRLVASLTLSAVLAGAFTSSVHGQREAPPPAGRDRALALSCGTDVDHDEQLLRRRLQAVETGNAVSYLQDPPVLSADWSATIALHDFVVVGDVASIQFQLYAEDAQPETWTRTETRQVGGRTVSVFNPSWPASTLARVLRWNRWGWDSPRLYWGEVLKEGVAPGDGAGIVLKIAPATLPGARVVRLGDDVQYAGNVVNIVMPSFADGFLADEHEFDMAGAAKRFYDVFEDTYDGLAFVSQETFLASYGGFHRHVRNAVRGIGLPVFDASGAYGSRSGRLQSVEMYPGSQMTLHDVSSHEIAHQWAAYFDWPKVTGLTRSGWQPGSHDPLWAEGETLLGSILSPMRRVVRNGDGWQVQPTPAPARFHPFTRYAMGLIGKDDVPEITLFDDQGQFGADYAVTPPPGTPVTGTTRTATIYNVIGMLGERSGPVPSIWSRATIVVSRNSLISPREMDYWNYFAQRLEDPGHTGVLGVTGVGSFESATGGRVPLDTDIRPLTGERVQQRFDVDAPPLGPRDGREVVFDAPLATRYHVGDRIRWSGHVSAPDRNDIYLLRIRLSKYDGAPSEVIRMDGDVSSASSFVVEKTFQPAERGVYRMDLYLYWPGAGPQAPRASLSPIFVE